MIRTAAKLDDIDLQIIEMLRADGRAGNRDIAKTLGVSEGTVRSRIRRLYQSGTLRVVAVSDVAAMGNEFFVVLWIQVQGRPIADIGAELAALPETLSVSLVSGFFDIVVTATARDKRHLLCLLDDQVGRIDGILSVECSVALDVVHSEQAWMAHVR